MTPTGLEHHSKTAEKQGAVEQGGAESGAVSDGADSELAGLVKAWPKLSSGVRAEILALIREAESVRPKIEH